MGPPVVPPPRSAGQSGRQSSGGAPRPPAPPVAASTVRVRWAGSLASSLELGWQARRRKRRHRRGPPGASVPLVWSGPGPLSPIELGQQPQRRWPWPAGPKSNNKSSSKNNSRSQHSRGRSGSPAFSREARLAGAPSALWGPPPHRARRFAPKERPRNSGPAKPGTSAAEHIRARRPSSLRSPGRRPTGLRHAPHAFGRKLQQPAPYE